jgi:hypothetical protein
MPDGTAVKRPPPRVLAARAGNALAEAMAPVHRLSSEAVPAPLHAAGCGSEQHGTARTRIMSLESQTDFTFHEHQCHTNNEPLALGSDCDGYTGRDCLQVTAEIVIPYSASTTFALPNPDNFPDAMQCERATDHRGIDRVLAPHEQQHIKAIEAYNGVERVLFSEAIYRSEFAAWIKEITEAREAARQQAARLRSGAFDLFSFTIAGSEGCEEQAKDRKTALKPKEPGVEALDYKNEPVAPETKPVSELDQKAQVCGELR